MRSTIGGEACHTLASAFKSQCCILKIVVDTLGSSNELFKCSQMRGFVELCF